MAKKILIVGGVAGGASAAARLRRLSEDDNIIMFEKGPHVSFSNCSLPYHLSGIVDVADKLVLMNPKKFMSQYRIDARVNNEVLSIDREGKKIRVKNTVTKEEYEETYDKLILSPGARPIVPRINGIETANVFTIRNVVDIDKLNSFIKDNQSKKVAVIGGGYIGVETAENLIKGGYDVTLIEALPQILKTFDYDMVQILHKEMMDKGVKLILNDKVTGFNKNEIILESGKTVEVGTVVMAIGVTPDITLAKEAGLEISELGAIKVDQNYKTNDQDIYAVGDAIEVFNPLSHSMQKISLAGPAQIQARAVADKINGIPVNNTGFIGSSAIKVFDYNCASTGLSEGLIEALKLNINYEVVNLVNNDKVGLMPSNSSLFFKLLFEVPTGKILGAQAIGKGDAVKRVDVIATAISLGATVEQLKNINLCYAPPFGTAKDIVNFAGYIGSNLLRKDFKQVGVNRVRELLNEGATIIDVREKNEYDQGHIKGVPNIPFSEIRERTNEIPTDKPVYIHCRSGQRSYNVALLLKHLGFNNIYNITGSYLALSYFEYFNDKSLNRESILTEYNFK